MPKHYRGIWMLMATALAVFVTLSFMDPLQVFGYELKQPGFAETLTSVAEPDTPSAPASQVAPASPSQPTTKADTGGQTQSADVGKSVNPTDLQGQELPAANISASPDTTAKTILFIGDSMLEGLSPRLAAYAQHNGHKLYTVIWYSSTSQVWGQSGKLAGYIRRLKPDFIFICLGANELFVRDIKSKRDKYVKKLISEAGNIPYVWIGPPNWKPDTGINDLIAANTAPGTFFVSNGMHFDRAKDGAHPTRTSAAAWMDSVARWMPEHCAHPIKMEKPSAAAGRPVKIFVHQPNEK